ncbi:linear amide C-N hydrolase [Methyloceanibacter sp.]|uniref:linear amide C-N hydrolase n=1 Tax=Methyloceanibacter sp. TaxID=1965321 RepID=UPI00351AE678
MAHDQPFQLRQLSVNDVESAKVGDVKVEAFGAGTGLLGIPGDFTPPSRRPRGDLQPGGGPQ